MENNETSNGNQNDTGVGDERALLNFLKGEKQTRILSGMIIKMIISGVCVYFMQRDSEVNASMIFLTVFLFVMFYDLCYLFQVVLRLTGNYLIAVIVWVLLIVGAPFGFMWLGEKVPILNDPNSAIGALLTFIIAMVIFAFPLVFDIVRIVKLSKK